MTYTVLDISPQVERADGEPPSLADKSQAVWDCLSRLKSITVTKKDILALIGAQSTERYFLRIRVNDEEVFEMKLEG